MRATMTVLCVLWGLSRGLTAVQRRTMDISATRFSRMAYVILSVIPNNASLMALTANHLKANASKMNW